MDVRVFASVTVMSVVREVVLVVLVRAVTFVTEGAIESTDHDAVAIEEVLPALSTARILKLWLPCDKPVKATGDVHVAKVALFKLHSILSTPEAESVAENEIVGEVVFDHPDGALTNEAVGATLSTVHVYEEGVSSVPVELVALTLKVWLPSDNPV
jgi:hypothetical protein